MGKERLRLVKSWSELRPGMIVLTGCDCGKRHRCILIRETGGGTGYVSVSGEPCSPEPVFIAEPHPHPRSGALWCVNQNAVDTRNVYRVLDGLDPAADAEQAAKDDKLAARRVQHAARAKAVYR